MTLVTFSGGGRNAEWDVPAVLELLDREGGHVHMLGVGGIGMAGLARILISREVHVTGCDCRRGAMTAWLAEAGISVTIGHDPSHITSDVSWIVRSTAVRPDHPELRVAREAGLPVFQRGAVLAACLHGEQSIAVTGTHGKTTTAAMTAQVLAACGMNPGFCIGGEVDVLGGVAGQGDGPLVVEADESDGTVALYEPDFAVVTNIEYDHMEHFESRGAMEECFEAFISSTRERVIYCADDPRTRALCGGDERGLAYGFAEDSDCRATRLQEDACSSCFNVEFRGLECGRVALPVGGRHNVQDALAACAVALELGCDFEDVRNALGGYEPVRRRFETVCKTEGRIVISDYCHHPSEISAVMQVAAKMPYRRRIAIFQPHRYTRTKALGKDFPRAFAGVDRLILVPVYAASEEPLAGGTTDDLYEQFVAQNCDYVEKADSLREAWNRARSILKRGDMLLVLGAGDVEQIADWARNEMS